MATKKFTGPSPYTLPDATPEEDYVFAQFVKNVNLNMSSTTSKPPIGVALFGLGRAGSIHLSSLANNPRVILKYLVDDRPERFGALKQYWKLSDDIIFLTPDQSQRVYDDKSVKVVFVATPTQTHQEIVLKAISSKKDVFCEKPIAKNRDDTKKCYEAAKANGCLLFCAFNRRFDPTYRNLKERVRKGEVGHVQMLKVTAKDSPIPPIEYLKTSGGIFCDMIIHDFDMACWVLGELPSRIQVAATTLIPELKPMNDYDNVGYLLTFPSGTIVLGDNSRYCAYGYDMRLEVFGVKGMIKVENEKPYQSTAAYIGQTGVTTSPIYYSFPSRFHAGYKAELEHFLDVVISGVPMDSSSYQTLAMSKLASAAEESARTGKAVDLDWSKDEIPANYS